jgi:hypothetical protein
LHSIATRSRAARQRIIGKMQPISPPVCTSSQEYREYGAPDGGSERARARPCGAISVEMSDHLRPPLAATHRAIERRAVRSPRHRARASGAGVGPAARRDKALRRQRRARSCHRVRYGGTTAKAGVIRSTVLMTGSAMIGGYATGLPVQIPMTINPGGGNWAARSRASSPAVRSTGRKALAPGPVCYGLGGPTITTPLSSAGLAPIDFLAGKCRSIARVRAGHCRSA